MMVRLVVMTVMHNLLRCLRFFMFLARLLTKFMAALMLLFGPIFATRARFRHYTD